MHLCCAANSRLQTVQRLAQAIGAGGKTQAKKALAAGPEGRSGRNADAVLAHKALAELETVRDAVDREEGVERRLRARELHLWNGRQSLKGKFAAGTAA